MLSNKKITIIAGISIFLVAALLVLVPIIIGNTTQKVKLSVTPSEGFSETEEDTDSNKTTYANMFGTKVVIYKTNLDASDIYAAKDSTFKELEKNFSDVSMIGDPELITVAGSESLSYVVFLTEQGMCMRYKQVLIPNYRDGYTLFQYAAPEENYDDDLPAFEEFLDSLIFLSE